MDYLWSPWRYRYVTRGEGVEDTSAKSSCVFCHIVDCGASDKESLIVHRGRHNFVMLNCYPYVSGHLMVVPYAHLATLSEVPVETAQELMLLSCNFEGVLRDLYKPDGLNLGMNIGRAAGAGVDKHIHMHLLPRWSGDVNFTTTIGETRVLPEDLEVTWERVHEKLNNAAG